jgi:hypothetical protein
VVFHRLGFAAFKRSYDVIFLKINLSTRAIVLRLYRTGNASQRKAGLLNAVRDAIGTNIAIVVSHSACMVVPSLTYATGRSPFKYGRRTAADNLTMEAVVTRCRI